jgi:tetratricopeptide (TPR) repeat protein
MMLLSLLAAVQATPLLDLAPAPDADAPRAYQSASERLEEKLDELLTAPGEEAAAEIASQVRSLWRQQAGPTADLLLQRGAEARETGDQTTAWRSYDHLRTLEPDYAEGWVVSAELAIEETDWDFALEALNQAVTLDARRYDAWALLGRALEQAQAREAAMEAYREALALYPLHPAAGPALARLERELAGRAL